MKILSINAKNYRTLENINIVFTGNYCTISGKNNSGKSCVIRLLQNLFTKPEFFPWFLGDIYFEYKDDLTQWSKTNSIINIEYILEVKQNDDPALITFIEKIISDEITDDPTNISIVFTIDSTSKPRGEVKVNGKSTDQSSAVDIIKKIRDSNLLFLYNSTRQEKNYFYGRKKPFYDVALSEDEKRQLEKAATMTAKKYKKLAREHKIELNTILGRLSEKYDVEFSPMEDTITRRMPLGINLKDKNVAVPLNDWGSGTQNRTHILLELLQANRIKTAASNQEKITPLVVVEEPESFLHPSAQAEFGKILRMLSNEMRIQVIITTHSPYMLNQENPESNILLYRECKRQKLFQTKIAISDETSWMKPFAEHLGINPQEFQNWRPLFSSYKSCVLLVEGPTDKEYFSFLQNNSLPIEKLNKDIEIAPYGGKDTLKNTLLVQFVLRKFDNVFITFDLDATSEVRTYLLRLGLKEGKDFLPLGTTQAGHDTIEGLLPESMLSAVNAKETALIMQLGSKDNRVRRDAKDKLKRKYLEEFVKHSNYSRDELKELSKIIKIINKSTSKK